MSNTELFPPDGNEGLIRPFTARELRAINNAIKRYSYRPRLSRYPNVDFVSSDTGSEVRVHIDELLGIYDQDRREAARQRTTERKGKQRREGRHEYS